LDFATRKNDDFKFILLLLLLPYAGYLQLYTWKNVLLEYILLQLFFVTNCGTRNTISFEKFFVFLHQYFPKYVYNVKYDWFFLVPSCHSCQICISVSFWKKFIQTISLVLVLTLVIYFTFHIPCVYTVKSSYFKMCLANYYYHYYYYYC